MASRKPWIAAVVLLVAVCSALGFYAGRLSWKNAFLQAENVRLQTKLADLKAQADEHVAAVREAETRRELVDWQREAMLSRLRQETDTKDVWFIRASGDPEAAAYQKALQSVFEEAGWRVRSSRSAGFPLRAGIFFLMADESPPTYVETVLAAFDDAGISITSGRGYRAFYEEKKRENPNWRGFDLAPDQDYVIAIGPKPTE